MKNRDEWTRKRIALAIKAAERQDTQKQISDRSERVRKELESKK
jgi:uncharacterized protein YqgV (UPF0045/DUF77 family)